MVLAILASCCTSPTHALILYMQTPHSVTCSQTNTKSFRKHLSLQKRKVISRTNPPNAVGAMTRIRKHQDVKTEVLQGNFNRNPRKSAGKPIQPLVTIPGASPCGGLRLGSTPWPAMASHLAQASASLQGRHGQPPHWDGSA